MSELLSLAGSLMRRDNNYPKAMQYIAEEIKKNPNNHKAFLMRGICEKQSKMLPRATTSFMKVIDIDPGNPEALIHLAHINIIDHDYKQAKQILDDIIKSENSFHAQAYELYGDLCKLLKKYLLASEYYSKAIVLNRNAPHLYYNKAICEYNIGKANNYSRDSIDNFKSAVTHAEVAKDMDSKLPKVDDLIKESVFGFFASKYSLKNRFYRFILAVFWFLRDAIIEFIKDQKMIADMKKKSEEAMLDPKMKIRTAQVWEDDLSEICFTAEKDSEDLSVLFIDMDDMHNLNAIYSMDGVDNMLRSIGRVMNKICGPNDIPVRFGGDEYIIIMKGGNKEYAKGMYNKFVEEVTLLHDNDDPKLGLDKSEARRFLFSCGIVSAPIDMENDGTPWDVQFRAKTLNCIDRAKLQGKNQLVIYDLAEKHEFDRFSEEKARKGQEALKEGKRA